ncbi:MAG TPA: cyclic nucleotide-binding domain-containing protein [Acidiferrobacterales bacterium]|nr:cyclic nucleotide-binding domain-containing protein [Acidiferrobacterales bacterium]
MAVSKQLADAKILRALVPISSLIPANFQKLAEKTFVEQLPAKEQLFKQGDIDNWTFYLLSGELVLSADNNSISRNLIGGSEVTKHPLVPQQPRQLTATARTPVSFIRVDSQLLDLLLTWDQQVTGYEVTEYEGDASDAEWMIKLLQTKAFLRLPAANIQTLFSRLQETPVKAGQVVINQGDKGDFYYIIKQGRCQVARKASETAAGVVLAELAEGDSFGEEALLSDVPRNASVSMLQDGMLMRLAKTDFLQLLKEPLLNWVAQSEGVAMVKAGAGLLDVRLENEYKNANIKGSINIPLYRLRLKADSLDIKRRYVIYCDTGRRSSAAAFLLSERGFEAYVLKGGLTALAKPPPTKNG